MNLPRLLLLAALATTAHAAPFTQPRPGPSVPADAALVSGDTAIADGILTISVRSTGPEITQWTHVFLDIGDSRQSYDHNSERPCGFGLEILFEGELAYRFANDDPRIWSWTPIAGATVQRSIAGDTLTLRVPLAPLGLPADRAVHVFAVAYDENYATALDTLPRATLPWKLSVPAKR